MKYKKQKRMKTKMLNELCKTFDKDLVNKLKGLILMGEGEGKNGDDDIFIKLLENFNINKIKSTTEGMLLMLVEALKIIRGME